jgi:penicillin-binding protein 1A
VVVVGLGAAVMCASLLVGVLIINAAAAPVRNYIKQVQATEWHPITFPQSSSIYAADGTLLTTINAGENRVYTKLSNIGQWAQDAVIANEDHSFYQEGAVNVYSIIRALIANAQAGATVQGGSTITQQLVKNAVIGSNVQTYARKVKEAILALKVEQMYSKQQILEKYLNEVYLGNGQYGFGTAARYYFNEPATKLTIAQAALLEGINTSPTSNDPVIHPNRARAARNAVLYAMATHGPGVPGDPNSTSTCPCYITQQQYQAAVKSPIKLHVKRANNAPQPFFVSWVIQQIQDPTATPYLDKLLGTTAQQRATRLFTGGYKIYTTYMPKWQQIAQNVISSRVTQSGLQGALVTLDVKTGAIRTMLSGQGYAHDNLDLVAPEQLKNGSWIGIRQPGSSFKPYTLVTAFQQGISPNATYASGPSPMTIPNWPNPCSCVYNAEPGGGGYVNLWTATADSINVVFAQLAMQVGADNIVANARKMGITQTPLPAVPSITLGADSVAPLQQASGYQTIADQGKHCPPYAVQSIRGPNGAKLFTYHPDCKQVIDPNIANLVTQMLQGVITGGTGVAANIGRPAAGKTGTTNNYADAWFVGYVPQYVTAVWVGDPRGEISVPDFQGMGPMFGGTAAAPIWHDYMLGILKGVPPTGFNAPGHIQVKSGKVPNVVGKTQAAATQILLAAHFSASVNQVPSTSPAGTVVSQSPAAGAMAPVGSSVTIYVSNGKPPKTSPSPPPATVTVPGVIGQSQSSATATITGAGLRAAVSYVTVTSASRAGIVIRERPNGGTLVPAGSTVTIYVGVLPSPSPSAPHGATKAVASDTPKMRWRAGA